MSELDNAEKIRENNLKRLSKLQETFKLEMSKGKLDDDFMNIKKPSTLNQLDSGLASMLTANPTHTKSVGLISTGKNIFTNSIGDRKYNKIEEMYLEESFDDPYSTAL